MPKSMRGAWEWGKRNTSPHVAWQNNYSHQEGECAKKGWKGPYLTFLSCGTADSILSSVNVWKKWKHQFHCYFDIKFYFLYGHNVINWRHFNCDLMHCHKLWIVVTDKWLVHEAKQTTLNKRVFLHENRVYFSHDFSCTPTGPSFHCMVHQYNNCCDVLWKQSIQ